MCNVHVTPATKGWTHAANQDESPLTARDCVHRGTDVTQCANTHRSSE